MKILKRTFFILIYFPITMIGYLIVVIGFVPIFIIYGKYSKPMTKLFNISFIFLDSLDSLEEI